MPPILKFLIRRLLAVPVTLLVVTAVMYGVLMLAPAETRAELYLPRGNSNNPGLRQEVLLNNIIREKGLNDPYPVQYFRWLGNLLQGDWGWSPRLRADVLEALVTRTATTAELTLTSILLLVPIGLISGGLAGSRENQLPDHIFRLVAFVATAIPPFILGLVLLTVFYAGLNMFAPGRLSMSEGFEIAAASFKTYTGLLTLDGLLNRRPDISLSALRHLVMPAITLSMLHWATLGRMTRTAMIEELDKDYIMAAKGRGLRQSAITWRHALRNALLPALNSIALSAASLIMGVFVVEVIFGFPGVSEVITKALAFEPDTAIAMGFAIYSVLLVLPVMLGLDILQAIFDPRLREGVSES